MVKDLVVALLVKDMAHLLREYLYCIELQDYPKENILLYVRTNDNNDDSQKILEQWLDEHRNEYKSVYYDCSSVNTEICKYKQHEWNPTRFSVLAKIRMDSIQYAIDHNADYFVCDTDNFITPDVISHLSETGLPVVGPFLYMLGQLYSNYHHATDSNGYFIGSDVYRAIHSRAAKGFIQVDVIHCTYFIRNDILPEISYMDETNFHEYVIFSKNLRKKEIPQYISNVKEFGYLTFADTREKFLADYEKYLCIPRISTD